MRNLQFFASVLGYVALAVVILALSALVVLLLILGRFYDIVWALLMLAGFEVILGTLIRSTNNPAVFSIFGANRHRHRAVLYQRLGMPGRALWSLAHHERANPNDPLVKCQKAGILIGMSRWKEALAAIDGAVEVDSEDRALMYRAKAYSYLGLSDLAARDLELVYKRDPKCYWRRTLVSELVSARRLKHAIAVTDESPTDHELCIWLYRGAALLLLGRTNEAIVCYERVLDEIDPTHPHQQHTWMLQSIDALGRLRRFAECRELIGRLDPSGEQYKVACIYVGLLTGEPQIEMEYLRYGLKVNPWWLISFFSDPDITPSLVDNPRLRELVALAVMKRREMLTQLGYKPYVF